MVVSRDWQEISVLECILGGLHMSVSVEPEPQSALQRLSRSKIDALIVDCDLGGTQQIFRELQGAGKNLNTVPLVIMGERQRVAALNQTGALFAFEKPISVEQAVRTLSAARCMILDGRLRYHRFGIAIPVSLKDEDDKMTEAYLVNVSQGGMQICAERVFEARDVQISCDLPGANSQLKARGEVVWRDDCGNMGIRFVKVPAQQQRALQLWLAQKFLAN